jgi:hypothetical protein
MTSGQLLKAGVYSSDSLGRGGHIHLLSDYDDMDKATLRMELAQVAFGYSKR